MVGIGKISNREFPPYVVQDPSEARTFADQPALQSAHLHAKAFGRSLSGSLPFLDKEDQDASNLGGGAFVLNPRKQIQETTRISGQFSVSDVHDMPSNELSYSREQLK